MEPDNWLYRTKQRTKLQYIQALFFGENDQEQTEPCPTNIKSDKIVIWQ